MKTAVVLCSLIALSTAQRLFPPIIPQSTCAATTCLKGTFCRAVLNRDTRAIQAQCLANPHSSLQDNKCSNNSPLLVSTGGIITQANCGGERDAIACPSGYSCIVGSGGAYSVCCRQGTFEKPGKCPAVVPRQYGFCPRNCRSDNDCKGADKCCRNSCGTSSCQTPEPSCDTVKCEAGQKCVLKDVQCIRAPCPPLPMCVPNCNSGDCTTKEPSPFPDLPSTCAATLCLQGTVCREELNPRTGLIQAKCIDPRIVPLSNDKNVCRVGQPLRIGTQVPTCGRSPNRINCPKGYFCNISPIDAFAVCCPSVSKPGQCPKLSPFQSGACVEACSSDSDCQGNQKCCSNGCGHTCQNPVSVPPVNPSCKTTECKPGYVCRERVSPCIFPPCPTHPVCEKAVSKPGQCPKLLPGTIGLCVEECSSDSDCQGNLKCCSNGCGHTCQKPVSVPPVNPSCKTVECKPGYVCKEKVYPCFRPPCSTHPVCEKAVTKPGQCPKLFPGTGGICVEACRSDSDCQGNQKCCSNGCGHTCQNPVSVPPVNPSCKTVECKLGYVCKEKVYPCFNPPCPTHPVCEKAVTKPGQCPKLFPGTVGICVEACRSDSDCQGNQKCCSNGCGHTCQNPVSVPPVNPSCKTVRCPAGQKCVLQTPKVCPYNDPCGPRPVCVPVGNTKPGQCPKLSPFQAGICIQGCVTDFDCQGIKKCCSNGCGRTCQDPVSVQPVNPSCKTVRCAAGQKCVLQTPKDCPYNGPCDPRPVCVPDVKPGTCPRRQFSFGGCNTQCRFDQDCPGSRKCCKSAFCGTMCQEPQNQRPTCANVLCKPGYVCKDQPVQCFVAPCPTNPVCEEAASQGRCPFFPAVTCLRQDFCTERSSCPRGTICCSSPCGRRCVKPLDD